MSANSRTHKNLRISCIREISFWWFIKKGIGWEGIGFFVFSKCKSSNKDELSIPRCLEDFTRGQLRDIEFFVRVSDVTSSCDHLMINYSKNGLYSEDVRGKYETLDHINLSSLDVIVFVFLIPESVFVKPVIYFGLSINGISKIWGSWRCYPEFVFFSAKNIIYKLLISSFVIFLHNTKVSSCLTFKKWD